MVCQQPFNLTVENKKKSPSSKLTTLTFDLIYAFLKRAAWKLGNSKKKPNLDLEIEYKKNLATKYIFDFKEFRLWDLKGSFKKAETSMPDLSSIWILICQRERKKERERERKFLKLVSAIKRTRKLSSVGKISEDVKNVKCLCYIINYNYANDINWALKPQFLLPVWPTKMLITFIWQ